ncbi:MULTISPECIES: polysaccharide pyruvyl transferase family protein [unclassified Oscillibacter]|uniref:polysaccharide pyruvyl transferase family protein n=1 Tax=unclassified Oscillibacter TaxID=2629304 RepID=UPI0025F0FC8E|nr:MULTISPECIES: polysaccharide pyruvyl transferase family protein [unclassified Oscillibacter]
MKTGLVTFFHIHHYGAVLQACATQRAVEQLGSSCEIFNYYVNQNNDLFRRAGGLSSAAANAHTALHYSAMRERYQRFEDFASRNLKITERRYESLRELESAPDCDVYLSGSDQIWNPKIFPDGRFDPVFFSRFTAGRKVAYAPSFGIPRIPDGMEEELRRYLDDFSHLSAREARGQAILREVGGREAPVVLDPTLLLQQEDWAALSAEPKQPSGYILCYCISAPGPLEPYIRRLQEETGLPVVQLCGLRQKVHPKAECVFSAGPAEFLGLFRHAAYVCTNSFHGTVFSVQFQKPFFTAVSPAELAAPEQSRIFSLLDRLGLADRIIGKGDSAGLSDPVDWSAATGRLEAERRNSLAYLRAALMNEPIPTPEKAESGSDLPELVGRADCTGCTACASVCPKDAISMEPDREGFAYPLIDLEKCIHCGRCTAVCPPLHPPKSCPLPAVFAAWNRDDVIRKDSTSGGVFSLIAADTLESGGVVFGAALDDRQRLRHIACFSPEDLRYLRGAKYVQSDLRGVYREIRELLKSRPVLFSGTPCQVDGLYHFLGHRPENLTTCDVVCQGVPSPGVWADMVRSIESHRRRSLQTVRFRNKVAGWKNSHFTLLYKDGSADSSPLFQTEWGRAFGRALFLRPCCHRCPYTSLSRTGDFTLGDFWGLRPDELCDQQEKGVSLLIVNTAHASHIFDRLPLGRQPFSPERAVAGNPRLASPIAQPGDRAAFFASYALQPFDQVRQKFLRLPSLPVRIAASALSPEAKAKIKSKLK